MADEGQVAGKLSILVEASLKTFKQRLEAGVEKAAKGVAAEVGIDVDEGDVRTQIEEKVKAAAKGVAAEVGLDVDEKGFKAKVKAVAKSVREKVSIKVDADTGTVVAETVAAAEAAEKAAPVINLQTRVDGSGITRAVSLIGNSVSSMFGGIFGGGSDAAGGAGGAGKGIGGRMLFRGGIIFGLLSLIQPLIGAIGQIVAGLTAMGSAAAPALGTLAAFPITIAAMIQGFMAGKVAMQGMGDAMKLLAEEQATLARGEKLTAEQQKKLNQAMKELSPSARVAARSIIGLRDGWVKVRKEVQEALFSKIADQIKPLATKMLPLLQRELSRTAGTLGRYTRQAMLFLQTDQAQGDVGKVMKNNNVIFGDFLYMMGQFGKGAIDFFVASRKFGRGAGDLMRDVGDWFSGKMAKGRQSGSIADFLDRASDKATQLWNIIRQFGGGMAGIFRAAVPSGERLLTTFEGFLTRWHEWVDSAKGQTFLRDWFDGAEGGFTEFALMVNDTFKAIAKWANDPKIARMLHMIRTEMGPALSDFFKKLGDDAGEGVLTFLSEFVKLATHLEPAIETIGELTKLLNRLLHALNALAEISPGATDAVAKVLGGLVVLKTLGRFSKMLGLVGKAAPGVGKTAGSMGKLGAALGRFSKMPLLKKAGFVGAVLTAIDIAKQTKNAYDEGKNLREAFNNGFADGPGTKKAKETVDTQFDSQLGSEKNGFWAGVKDPFGANGARWMDDFNIDVDRLKEDVQKFGTSGDYYAEVVKKLQDASKSSVGNQLKNGAGFLPWVNFDPEKAESVLGRIERLGAEAQRAIAAYSKKQSIQWNIESLIKLGKAKIQDSAVVGAQAQLRQTIMEKLGIKPNADGKGGLFDLLIDPIIKTKKPRGEAGDGRGANANPFSSVWGTTPTKDPKGPKAPDVKPIKRSAEEIRRAAERAGAAWGETATRVVRSAKKQAGAVGGIKKSLDGVPKKVKAVGDSWNGAAKKANNGARMTAKGAKTLEVASKRAESAAKRSGAAASKAYNGMEQKARKAANGATKAISNMTNQVKSKVATLGRVVSRGMDGVVKAVRSKVGPSKAAAKQIANGIHGAFKSLPSKMTSIGGFAMDGLANGIRTRGAAAVEAARSIAAQIEAASRVQLDTHSPSRVMAVVGDDTMDGLTLGLKRSGGKAVSAMVGIVKAVGKAAGTLGQVVGEGIQRRAVDGSLGKNLIDRLLPGADFILKQSNGTDGKPDKPKKVRTEAGKRRAAFKAMLKDFLTGSFFEDITKGGPDKVRKAFKTMYAKLDKIIPNTKAGKKRLRAIKAEFRDEMRLLAKNAAEKAKVREKIAKAQAEVEDLISRRDNMRESFKNAANETGDIRNIAAANGGYISPGRLVAQLKRKVAKALEFKKLLADLRGKGLGEEAYQQLVDLGFDEGLPIARQLAKGDSAALQEITRLQQELDGIAEEAANESSATFFDAGIKAGEAMVKKLKDDLGELTNIGKEMGKAFLSELEGIFGLDLGVKNGQNLNESTSTDGGGGSGNGNGMHKWEPKSDKDRKCKKCGKARNTSKHSNRTDAKGGPADSGGPVNATGGPVKGSFQSRLNGSASSARSEAASPDSYVVNEPPVQFSITGVPDQATASKVMNEAQFHLKKIRAGGRRRGRPVR